MKLYVVSDIHGFYDEFVHALDKSGFNPEDPEHLLIVCGDTVDRGANPGMTISYLSNLMDTGKCVVVRGNHESLVLDCCARGFPYSYDYSNGTFDTICELGGAGDGRSFDGCCIVAEEKFKPFVEKMVDYYETENYIFVHSFIPLKRLDDMPKHYTRGRVYEQMDNWREAHSGDWEDARWGNPFDLAKRGLLPDKCLVFGHWHTSWPRHHWSWSDEVLPEFGLEADFSPYYGDGFIGIDGCTAYSGVVNIIVLEDNLIK